MAYPARERDPLLDRHVQAALARRGREALGLLLIALGLGVALVLGSYVPDDPSWLSATDAPAANLLGRFGASVASPLVIVIGLGAWAIAVLLLVWGLRFVAHRGAERALGRAVFAPIAVALASVYASTHAPGAGWTHSFGLGGLFGDTVLGATLGVVPVQATLGLRILSGAVALALAALGLFVLGVDRGELRAGGRFLAHGALRALAATGYVAGAAARGGLGLAVRAHRARRARSGERYAGVAEPSGAPAEAPARPGLLARVPLVSRRARVPDPELVETDLPADAEAPDASSEDRLRARISDAVRNRGRRDAPAPGPHRPEPRIARPAAGQAPAEDPADPPAPAEPKRLVQQALTRPLRRSRQAEAETQPALDLDAGEAAFAPPPLSLLTDPQSVAKLHLSEEALQENARMLETVLDDYGVKGDIVSVRPGPVVTMYELEPAPGLKASRVIGLADDIARSMSALAARVSTVAGRSVIGIELPNASREQVLLRELLSTRDYGDGPQKLPLTLGKDIGGGPVIVDLAKMPHLLIAGTTGSGKSVAINTMILSLLYKLSPDECRLIMIDPKMLELSVYDGIPHLLSPVVTDPKKAVVALKWVVAEMEERYRRMSKTGVRNIEGYNARVRDALGRGEGFTRTVQTGFDDATGEPVFETEEFEPETMPYIVVIVDEMADLMMVAGKEIEACIQRLAQMARASGIHLIMATQRPSVDVITGTIKANFPTRISFQVTGKIDSRTILGEQGAEQLLGMGDMLYMAGGARITRVHGPFVADDEVEEVVRCLKANGPPAYVSGVAEGPERDAESGVDEVLGLGGNTTGEDALYDQAVAIAAKDRKASTSYIQRKLGIGYNKAARLVEQMEDQGVVSPANHVGKREVLVPEP